MLPPVEEEDMQQRVLPLVVGHPASHNTCKCQRGHVLATTADAPVTSTCLPNANHTGILLEASGGKLGGGRRWVRGGGGGHTSRTGWGRCVDTGRGGQGSIRGEGGGGRGGDGGGWNPKVCVPKMAHQIFPMGNFVFFPTLVTLVRRGGWGGPGGGGLPYGARPF